MTLSADPSECSFQFNPTGTAKFTSSCDIAKQLLAGNSVNYESLDAPAGTMAVIKVGDTVINGYAPSKISESDIVAAKEAALKGKDATANLAAFDKDPRAAAVKVIDGQFKSAVNAALNQAGYPAKADPDRLNKPLIVGILTLLVIYVTMVYGPIAAMLVEMFPTRIRYTSMSLPYHIGNGWFGGLLPTTAFAIVAQTGNIYNGLWYPIIVAGATFVIGLLFVRETKDVDICAND